MCNAKTSQRIGTKICSRSSVRLIRKKGFRFLGNITFILFQSDWLIRERREVDDVMLPSCLVLNEQACGSSVMI